MRMLDFIFFMFTNIVCVHVWEFFLVLIISLILKLNI